MVDGVAKGHIQTLWSYSRLDETLPEHADAIIVPGCCDLSIVDRAAELYHEGVSEIVVMSGERGRMSAHYVDTEALTFARYAHTLDIPKSALFLEENATNTGENIRFSERLLRDIGRAAVDSVVIVQKPYLERRLRATFDKQWRGEANGYVTSIRNDDGQPMDFDEYVAHRHADEDDIARYVLDTMHRIMTYPERGFHTEQPMPDKVLEAYQKTRRSLGTAALFDCKD